MNEQSYELGTIEASEQLIQDLYIDLRKKANHWASITHQTAQARMGYVGQHLVSVVTGYQGGRSGARGKDLILPNNEHAEIKTCYRVDQLGRCNDCGARVASIELFCPECRSANLQRNDDSKWLIGIRHEEEFASILEPKYYYLVLFEFTDLNSPHTIQSSIWRVESNAPGFSLCMIDYYKNIRSSSSSKAPFNLWPYQLKFDIMRPYLIYRSLITQDDEIETLIFPNRDGAQLHRLKSLTDYSRSRNLTREKILKFAEYQRFLVDGSRSKLKLLETIQNLLDTGRYDPHEIADNLAKALYYDDIQYQSSTLPPAIREKTELYLR